MTHLTKYLVPLGAILFLFPAVSFAATPTAQELSSELGQIQTQLLTSTSTIATFTLSPGQSIQQATSSSSNGSLTLAFPTYVHTNNTPITWLAQVTLQYEPCVAVAPSVCTSNAYTPVATSSYPIMTSNMEPGQATNYLNYNIALTELSSTTGTFVVTDSPSLASIQNEINAVAVKVHALLGN